MPAKKRAGEPQTTRIAPDLPASLPVLDGDNDFGESEIQIAEHEIHDLRLDERAWNNFGLEACQLQGVSMARVKIRSAKWKDVRASQCDLANAELRGMMAVRVELVGCRMTGFQANEANWQSLLISGGDQRYAQFRFSAFKSSVFEDCDFQDADFYGTDLRGCVFRRCNLRNAEMSKAKLVATDLRGCEVEGMRLGAQDIAGAIVDAAQALIFAPLLGIQIL